MDIPVLIPAYKPTENLLNIAESLISLGCENIIIVNDGSGPEFAPIFEKLRVIPQCHVLEHAVNLGKGRALKTGFNHIYLKFREAKGILTADADGQHLPEDVLKVAKTFLENSDKLVMGTRKFGKSTPMRSLVGNVITQYVFRLFVGKKISDTQSGLRCIPMTMIPDLLRLEGEKYEFEMNMLISTKIAHIDIMDEAIQTVYLDNNKSSHFNPLTDSMRIYFLLIRFSVSSIFASTIDFVVFTVLYMLRRDILTSMVLARLVSGSVNFLMNKTLVFHSRIETVLPLVKYFALFIALAVLSYLSIRTIAGFGVNVIVAKALTESLLFFASFSIQRDFIFIGQKEK